ncbi:protein of unknown function [Magnetospirillum sp. XM-1]|nr:protein of unknown function [Magnetospirillum sp. XM-1]
MGITVAEFHQTLQGALHEILHGGQIIDPDLDHHHDDLQLEAHHPATRIAAAHGHQQGQHLHERPHLERHFAARAAPAPPLPPRPAILTFTRFIYTVITPKACIVVPIIISHISHPPSYIRLRS